MLMDMPSDFKISRIKREKEAAQIHPDSHTHPFHEIFYMVNGECTSLVNHNIYKFSKGDLLVVPAGALHRTTYTGSGTHERIVVSFREDVINWINEIVGSDVAALCMRPGVLTIPDKRRDYVEGILNKMLFESAGQDPLSPGFIRVSLVELLLFIIRCKQYEENVVREMDVSNMLMQEVATYIYENYDKPITMEDMMTKFGISRSYLSKKFKAATGFGFKEYLINVRIKNACELLLNTDRSITDVAFACGFNDSNYFGDAFRHIKGVSPNKYRKRKEMI